MKIWYLKLLIVVHLSVVQNLVPPQKYYWLKIKIKFQEENRELLAQNLVPEIYNTENLAG